MAKIVCAGITVADVLITGLSGENYSDEIRVAESIRLSPGGDAFNEAVILSRLGNDVRLLAGVGRDDAGELILAKAAAAGVDISRMQQREGAATPVFVLLIDDAGERKQISRRPGSVVLFEPEPAAIGEAQVVSIASLFRPPFDTKETILAFAKAAKAQGAVVCADIKTNDGSVKLSDFGEALSYIDYIFPNEAEAAFHSGKETPEEMAKVFLQMGFGHVIIKLGRRGCYAASPEEGFYVPSFLVEAVDSTGAGDNFASGFMTALVERKSFRECCVFASAVAAVSVQSVGATAGVRSRAQVDAFFLQVTKGKEE